ncbi:MAG: Lpg1974 family pore-forming outer membrane protein [Chlamydiota bacterium]
MIIAHSLLGASWASDVCKQYSNYNAAVYEDCSLQAYAKGSLLYWQPLAEGLELGLVTTDPTFSIAQGKGRVVQTRFHYTPGWQFSVGIGGFPDDWELRADYTYLRATSSTKKVVSSYSNIYTQRLQEGNAVLAKRLDSSWRAKFSALDGGLTRTFFVGPHLIFSPLVGGKLAFLRQDLHTTYGGGEITSPNQEAKQSASSRSWGLGPRGALASEWVLPEGFSLLGSAAYSFLFTRYHIEIDDAPTSSTNARFLVDQVEHTFRSMYEISLGTSWNSSFPLAFMQWGFSAQYTFLVLPRQNVFSPIKSDPTGRRFAALNDFYLHGGILSTQIHF